MIDYFKDRPDDLLIMNMSKKAGWKELCPFLKVPIPSIDYPKTGVTNEINGIKLINEVDEDDSSATTK